MCNFIHTKILIFFILIGHAIFPSVYKDMQNPKQYPKMVNYTYIMTTVIYFLMAVCGYIMFGRTVMQEVSFNATLNISFILAS
jgi:amino acid permease